jgi:hypothetical protein
VTKATRKEVCGFRGNFHQHASAELRRARSVVEAPEPLPACRDVWIDATNRVAVGLLLAQVPIRARSVAVQVKLLQEKQTQNN